MKVTNGLIDQISQTVQVADEIAFRASLLALSAAVEAAAARRSTEITAGIARMRKRENSF